MTDKKFKLNNLLIDNMPMSMTEFMKRFPILRSKLRIEHLHLDLMGMLKGNFTFMQKAIVKSLYQVVEAIIYLKNFQPGQKISFFEVQKTIASPVLRSRIFLLLALLEDSVLQFHIDVDG